MEGAGDPGVGEAAEACCCVTVVVVVFFDVLVAILDARYYCYPVNHQSNPEKKGLWTRGTQDGDAGREPALMSRDIDVISVTEG